MKAFALSLLYAIVVIVLLVIIDYLLLLTLDLAIIDMLNWFNRKKLVWKIVIFIFGGTLIFWFIMGLVNLIAAGLAYITLHQLPINVFTVIFSILVAFGNISLCIYVLYRIVPEFNFWTTLEFIFLCLCIIGLHDPLVRISKNRSDQRE